MRHIARWLPLAAVWAGSLAGQATTPWSRSLYPTGLGLSGNTGPQLGLGIGLGRSGDSLTRYPFEASLNAEGGYGWRGSWFGMLAFRAPGLWPGWRLTVTGLAQRETRFEFLGLGNRSAYDPDSITDTQPHYYRLRRTRYLASVEGTRVLLGGWSVALAVRVLRTRFDSLSGPSLFLSSYGPAVVEGDQTARFGVIFDSRNSEYDPRRGLFVDMSVMAGSGGGRYTRLTGVTRAYFSLGPRTTAAVKLASSRLVGSPTLTARFEFPMWEGSLDVLGGPATHRGLRPQRFVGEAVEFGAVELRRSLLRARNIELEGNAFVDAGRVFEDEAIVPFKDLRWGPGLGFGVRLKGKSLVHAYVAHGPDGIVVSSRTGWEF